MKEKVIPTKLENEPARGQVPDICGFTGKAKSETQREFTIEY